MRQYGWIPQRAINVDKLGIDSEHINDRGHNVDLETAKTFIKNARVSITKRNGEFENYYSDLGAAFVNVKGNYVRTAFDVSEYDEKSQRLMEVLDKYEK